MSNELHLDAEVFMMCVTLPISSNEVNCLWCMQRRCITLNNNTLDLLLISKVDIAPDPDSDKGECSNGSSCNAHIPLRDTKSNADCVSGRATRRIVEGIEIV